MVRCYETIDSLDCVHIETDINMQGIADTNKNTKYSFYKSVANDLSLYAGIVYNEYVIPVRKNFYTNIIQN